MLRRDSRLAPCWIAAGALVASIASLAEAQPAIYRCDDGKGGVLYADAPCKGGVTVDFAAGKADPKAIERLQREQRAFDERHAAREAQWRAEAQARSELRQAEQLRERAPPPAPSEGYPPWAWGGYWPWPPVVVVPPAPPRPPRPASSVPASPGRFGLPSPPPASSGSSGPAHRGSLPGFLAIG